MSDFSFSVFEAPILIIISAIDIVEEKRQYILFNPTDGYHPL